MLASWLRALALCMAPAAMVAQQSAPPPQRSNGGSPAVSPDGARIAFTSDRDGKNDIYVIGADGTGLVRVTNTSDREGSPGWTGDGRLLFSIFASDSTALYAAVPGGTAQLLAKVAGRGPVLAPDGNRILYTGGTFTSNRLLESDLDGGNARHLTSGPEVVFNHKFSLAGGQIAYTRMDSSRAVQVWVMNRDGGDARAVTHFAPADGRPQVPAWSPDGRQLAFQANVQLPGPPPQSASHVWLVDLATGATTRLAAHDQPYLDETPSWFPDARRIAFQSNRTGQMEIWVMNVDGSGARQVTR